MVLGWGIPHISRFLTQFLSFFQVSSLVFPERSTAFRVFKFSYEVSPSALYTIIITILTLECIYLTFLIFTILRVNSYKGYQQRGLVVRMLAVFRLMLSKMLFLPIFEILSFPLFCTKSAEIGGAEASKDRLRSVFSQSLSCVLTPASPDSIFEQNLVLSSMVILVFHTAIGLISEAFDFEINLKSSQSAPK